MDNQNKEQTTYTYSTPRKERPRSRILIGILLTLVFVTLFLTCIIGGNIPPFTREGREAVRAIMIFAGILFLAFAIVTVLLAASRNKVRYFIATKQEKKFNIVEEKKDDKDGSNNENVDFVMKSKHNVSSLIELNDYFEQYAASYGIKSKSLPSLLASIYYSRLTIIKTKSEALVKTFANYFGGQYVSIDYTKNKKEEDFVSLTITDSYDFMNACNTASNEIDIPTFFVINHTKLKEVASYLEPIYNVIASPNEKSHFVFKGDDISIPKNLNFILVVDEEEEIFDCDKKLLEHAIFLEPEVEEIEKGEPLLPANVTYTFLKSILKDAKQNYSINEDSWKRVDSIIDVTCANTDYGISNRSYLKIENYSLSLFLFLKDDFLAIDETLANVTLISILSHWEKDTFINNSNIEKHFVNILGSKTPKTMQRYKHFRKLFNDKGERL